MLEKPWIQVKLLENNWELEPQCDDEIQSLIAFLAVLTALILCCTNSPNFLLFTHKNTEYRWKDSLNKTCLFSSMFLYSWERLSHKYCMWTIGASCQKCQKNKASEFINAWLKLASASSIWRIAALRTDLLFKAELIWFTAQCSDMIHDVWTYKHWILHREKKQLKIITQKPANTIICPVMVLCAKQVHAV